VGNTAKIVTMFVGGRLPTHHKTPALAKTGSLYNFKRNSGLAAEFPCGAFLRNLLTDGNFSIAQFLSRYGKNKRDNVFIELGVKHSGDLPVG
jgi:hypothetical protein